MAKQVWLTLVSQDAAYDPVPLLNAMGSVGIEARGGRFDYGASPLQWSELMNTLAQQPDVDAWILAIDAASAERPEIRYALSLTAAHLAAVRGPGFHMGLLSLDASDAPTELPFLLSRLTPYAIANVSWAASLVARLFSPTAAPGDDWRLNVHADTYVGQWFEVGPVSQWHGALFGVSQTGCDHQVPAITHVAVGPRGALPQRAVLEYPVKDMKLQVGDDAYTAWAVSNELAADQSFYVKVEGLPRSIVFAGSPGEDQALVNVVRLG